MMPDSASADERYMQLAIDRALQGQGWVEPNPMVGCVIVENGQVLAAGAHLKFGGPHAEVHALQGVAAEDRDRLKRATVYVTLEPCSHVGKTGPCADALIEAEVAEVCVAIEDPNPAVAGRGLKRLRDAGVKVRVGVLEESACQLMAPYLTRTRTGLPWLIGKWAMSLDGKIATHTGHSQWISNAESRRLVHQLRSRVDGVMIGIGTALADDPMLNARLRGQTIPRVATRIVVDPRARLPVDCQLVASARDLPVLVATTAAAPEDARDSLEQAGVTLVVAEQKDGLLEQLLAYLGDQGMTNVLVEGGAGLLGSLNDGQWLDEVQLFVGPQLIGGGLAPGAISGVGFDRVDQAPLMQLLSISRVGDDVHAVYRRSVSGR